MMKKEEEQIRFNKVTLGKEMCLTSKNLEFKAIHFPRMNCLLID